MESSNQPGWDRKYNLREDDFHEKKLPDDIGVKWKELARELGFNQAFIDIIEKEKIHCAKECCIEVLVCWLRQEGEDATAEKLFEALVNIGLKSVAERFPFKPSDPSQVAAMGVRIKELEDEVLTIRARVTELENGTQQKGEGEGNDASEEAKQAARESRVSEMLEKCKEKLETYVSKPLMVPEVREDRLPRVAVTVDVLKVLSEHLEEQYNTTLDIAPEACQCSKDLRERFYYFAYHALRAEHDEMNLKVTNLKKTFKKRPKMLKKSLKILRAFKNVEKIWW
ncbi:PREDICTED: uncharacterized protein LOC107335142 isoform X2 [Acropora digitifera]|uniref:uncharacterized protein LOC107335142 isoform X2 n=1 Tax=Acropora digitifera TaxID=70779 RepID=UPI00077AAE63|nr:PREDICTED: uncharacterized protein LOC107335142 isoform X2 [Acropora digitifera]